MSHFKPARLTITVSADGKVESNFFNFVGSACLDTGRQLHSVLAEFGIETEVTSFIAKPELSAPPASTMLSQAERLREGV